ncbi:MAG: heparan-alpha-glucosaminide N-acetyltransferase domain-containing protein [Bacteroidota bacterium]
MPAVAPQIASARIVGYDLARALAVFGMVAVNFKIVLGAPEAGPAWLAGGVGLLEGRAAATFVVLAGVGLSLLSRTGRQSGDPGRRADDRSTTLRRALFLFVVGLAYTPIWPADILHFYGVYLAVSAFLLHAPARRLGAYAAGLVVAFVGLALVLDYEQGWNWETLEYEGLWTPAGMARHLVFNGFHPVIPWLGFVLLGMIVGRMDVRLGAVRRRLFAWGVGVAVGAEVLSRGLIAALSRGASPADQEVVGFLFGTSPMPPMPLYMLAAGGTACALIAAAVAVGERFPRAPWLRPLVATGQLALTLYVAHVVIGMGTLEAMGRLGGQSLGVVLAASAVFCTGGVVFAHLWRLRFSRGPLEAAMRWITTPREGSQP